MTDAELWRSLVERLTRLGFTPPLVISDKSVINGAGADVTE